MSGKHQKTSMSVEDIREETLFATPKPSGQKKLQRGKSIFTSSSSLRRDRSKEQERELRIRMGLHSGCIIDPTRSKAMKKWDLVMVLALLFTAIVTVSVCMLHECPARLDRLARDIDSRFTSGLAACRGLLPRRGQVHHISVDNQSLCGHVFCSRHGDHVQSCLLGDARPGWALGLQSALHRAALFSRLVYCRFSLHSPLFPYHSEIRRSVQQQPIGRGIVWGISAACNCSLSHRQAAPDGKVGTPVQGVSRNSAAISR